jgi:hypothetical protein
LPRSAVAILVAVPELLQAHVAHYLWTLYVPPVLIVLFSIARSVVVQRREEREERQGAGEESA